MTTKKLITATGTIQINKSLKTVFDFVANPGNDPAWRTEINQSQVEGTLQVGTNVLEYSYLSKKAPNNLVELRCVQFDRNRLAVFETPEHGRFFQRSERQVTAVSDNVTNLVYTLAFDSAIVKFALGFSLPGFIISFKANADMKKYLRQLKTILEKTETS